MQSSSPPSHWRAALAIPVALAIGVGAACEPPALTPSGATISGQVVVDAALSPQLPPAVLSTGPARAGLPLSLDDTLVPSGGAVSLANNGIPREFAVELSRDATAQVTVELQRGSARERTLSVRVVTDGAMTWTLWPTDTAGPQVRTAVNDDIDATAHVGGLGPGARVTFAFAKQDRIGVAVADRSVARILVVSTLGTVVPRVILAVYPAEGGHPATHQNPALAIKAPLGAASVTGTLDVDGRYVANFDNLLLDPALPPGLDLVLFAFVDADSSSGTRPANLLNNPITRADLFAPLVSLVAPPPAVALVVPSGS